MKRKVGCFKKAEAGAVDKEQQLGTASANLCKHMEKAIILELILHWICSKDCLIFMILKVGCFTKAEVGAVDQEQQLWTG